jgi:hypothetical protein
VSRRARWTVAAVALAAVVGQFLLLWTFDAGARRAVQELYAGSAWVDPASPVALDVERARRVVGDRPLVAAALPASDEPFDRCRDVVARHDDVVALVWTGPERSAVCVGDAFPDPDLTDESASEWLETVILDASFSSRFRVDPALPDRTPELEELVLSFDAAVPGAYSEGVPRRVPEASPAVGLEIAVRLLAAAAAVVVVFVGVRLLARRVAAARARRRAVATRRLEQLARTARLADALLAEHPADPARARTRADAAGRYVLALGDVEAAHDGPALDAADAVLDDLERDLLRGAGARRGRR